MKHLHILLKNILSFTPALYSFITFAGNQPGGPINYQPVFTETSCPFPITEEHHKQIRCGTVKVPENYENPDGRQLKLAVAVLPSLANEPVSDPVIFIPGGPGSAGLGSATLTWHEPLRQHRDMILFDPRGVGESEPEICKAFTRDWWNVTYFSGLGKDERLAAQVNLLEACRSEADKAGVDLSQYHSKNHARDLEMIRIALGYESWNLFGRSYGSRVALEAMRTHPAGIRTLILDGPSPPNAKSWYREEYFDEVLYRIFELCTVDSACSAAYPGIREKFRKTFLELQQNPLMIKTGSIAELPDTIVFNDASFVHGIFSALYSKRTIEMVPFIIQTFSEVDKQTLMQLVPLLLRNPDNRTFWVYLSVNCYEKFPFRGAPADISLLSRDRALIRESGFDPDDEICNYLHPFRASPHETEPIISDIPTLIFVGEFDPATHRDFADLTAMTLSSSAQINIPGTGHDSAASFPCTRDIITDFLNNPFFLPDASCINQMPSVRFITDRSKLIRTTQ